MPKDKHKPPVDKVPMGWFWLTVGAMMFVLFIWLSVRGFKIA